MRRCLSFNGPLVYRRNRVSSAVAPDLSLAPHVPHGQTGGRDRRGGDGTRDGGRKAMTRLWSEIHSLLIEMFTLELAPRRLHSLTSR